jgi:hypothetical protein
VLVRIILAHELCSATKGVYRKNIKEVHIYMYVSTGIVDFRRGSWHQEKEVTTKTSSKGPRREPSGYSQKVTSQLLANPLNGLAQTCYVS